MARKSTNESYGAIAVVIHWLSALLIVALLGLGFRAGQTLDSETKANILRIHASLGIAVLLLTLARIVWWWRFDTKPAALEDSVHWQERAAKAVHILFYITILGMVASGIGMLVLSGAGPIVFGGAQGTLPDFHSFLPRVPHGIGARAMLLLFVIHAGAALYHHFIRRDATLRRMWFGHGVSK